MKRVTPVNGRPRLTSDCCQAREIGQRKKTALMMTLADVSTPLGEAASTLSVARAIGEGFGYSITLIAPRSRSPRPILDLPVGSLKWSPNVMRIGLPNTFNVFGQLRQMLWILLRKRTDLVYIRHSNYAFLQALCARLFTRAHVIAEHNGWQAEERRMVGRYGFLAPLEERLQIWLARLAHRNRVVIADNAARLRKAGIAQNRVILAENGTNADLIQPQEREPALAAFGLDARDIHIGFVGSFAAWQGLDDLVKMLAQLCSDRPNIRLVLAGRGPMQSTVEALAHELDVAANLRFFNPVPYSNLPQLLACFDVAVLPSKPVGYGRMGRSPMKLYDYAAAGCPIVAARVPGLEPWEKDGWLTCYPAGDVDALTQAVTQLLDDPKQRREVGHGARQAAEAHFAWPSRLAALLEPLQ